MSKRGYISRYLLILKKLKLSPFCSFEELNRFISEQSEYLQLHDDSLSIGFSKRTLQRDLKEIRTLFGIDIEYSKSGKGYYISQNETENVNSQRVLEAFEIFNSLNVANNLAPFVSTEKQKPIGTEHLQKLLYAIKNKLIIRFFYQEFWENGAKSISMEPYAIKEFKNRWYVIGKEKNSGEINKFSLDRLTNPEITKIKFEIPLTFNINSAYQHCFGIIISKKGKPQKIKLSFNALQGKYVKSLPLHHSQKIISESKSELLLELTVFATHDFIMELLSFGENVVIRSPKSLANKIKNIHKKALNHYSNG